AEKIVERRPFCVLALRTLVPRVEIILEEVAVVNLVKAVLAGLACGLVGSLVRSLSAGFGARDFARNLRRAVRGRRWVELRIATDSRFARLLARRSRNDLARLLIAPLGFDLLLELDQFLQGRRRVLLRLVQQWILQQLLRDRL